MIKKEIKEKLDESSDDVEKEYSISARFRAHNKDLNASVVIKYSGKGKTIEEALADLSLADTDDLGNLNPLWKNAFPKINSNVVVKVVYGDKSIEKNLAKHIAWAILIDGNVAQFNRTFRGI